MLSSLRNVLDAFHRLTEAPEGPRLQGVFEVENAGRREKLYLQFQTGTLKVEANPDLDTLHVYCEDSASVPFEALTCISQQSPWSLLLGQEFGWGWAIVNQQGYLDGALLSFGGIEPNLLLSVVGSSLLVYHVQEVVASKTKPVPLSNGVARAEEKVTSDRR